MNIAEVQVRGGRCLAPIVSGYGSMWTLAAAVLAWLGLGWVRSLGYAEDGFGVTLLSTAFAAILVAGLEAAAFGLMPLRFMPGHAVYKWNRLACSPPSSRPDQALASSPSSVLIASGRSVRPRPIRK